MSEKIPNETTGLDLVKVTLEEQIVTLEKRRETLQKEMSTIKADLQRVRRASKALGNPEHSGAKKRKPTKPAPTKALVMEIVTELQGQTGGELPVAEELRTLVWSKVAERGFSAMGLAMQLQRALDTLADKQAA